MNKKIPMILAFSLVVSLLAACNLPGQTEPTQDLFPTPNMTLTALFAPGGIPPTVTPPGPGSLSALPQAARDSRARTRIVARMDPS